MDEGELINLYAIPVQRMVDKLDPLSKYDGRSYAVTFRLLSMLIKLGIDVRRDR